jgi:hypothetical protein
MDTAFCTNHSHTVGAKATATGAIPKYFSRVFLKPEVVRIETKTWFWVVVLANERGNCFQKMCPSSEGHESKIQSYDLKM